MRENIKESRSATVVLRYCWNERWRERRMESKTTTAKRLKSVGVRERWRERERIKESMTVP
jgi:hypothetical protein